MRLSPSFIMAAAVLMVCGCARPKLVYTPNPPLMARNAFAPQAENGLFFEIKAGVEPFDDGTDPGFAFRAEGSPGARTFSANLAREGSEGWPRLSPEVLARAFAAELSSSNVVGEASAVVPDADHAEFADALADNAGDNLVFKGRVLNATLTYSNLTRGRADLSLELDAYGSLPGDPPFSDPIWGGTFSESENLNGRRPSEVLADALRKLYGQALQSFAQTLTSAKPGSETWRALEPQADSPAQSP